MELAGLIVRVFGGLAIFVYGMKLMGDGLHAVAGEKMRTILRMFSANRFVAIFSGAAVTAVVQSSSASTVMVIGFVNAGLLTLVQSIGIIFGANIGTTITAQLVAFDIQGIVMPALILGLSCKLIKNCCNHFHMRQFFCTDRSKIWHIFYFFRYTENKQSIFRRTV